MAARVEAIPNQLANIFARLVGKIDSKLDATKWLTSPKTKRRGTLGEATAVDRPAILVQIESVNDLPGPAVGRHAGSCTILIHCVVDGFDATAEAMLVRMASDVLEVLAENEYPVTDEGVQILTFDRIEYRLSVEAMEQSGFGIATISVPVNYTWTHGAP